MECQPYITVDEFKLSPYFCHFPDCCLPTGMIIDNIITGFITEAQDLINSYLGWEICVLPREDIFTGDYQNSYFTDYSPIIAPSGNILEYQRIRNSGDNYYSFNVPSSLITGTVDIRDKKSGLVRFYQGFREDFEYKLSYYAGYEIIPSEIKTAMYMLILNLAQRLDTGNLSNPDISIDRIDIDKSASYNFGAGKMIKNIISRSINELSDLPLPVKKILDRFKINKLS